MAKTSPGPWSVQDLGEVGLAGEYANWRSYVIESADGERLAILYSEPDARLMAAAPKLAAALRALMAAQEPAEYRKAWEEASTLLREVGDGA